MKICTKPEELVSYIQSNQRVFVHGASATPEKIIEALVADAARLRNVEMIHIHTHGACAYSLPQYKNNFSVANLFVGENLRHRLDYDQVDYLPCFLSEIPLLFKRGIRTPDVAIVQVSPPDLHGYCTIGVSVDIARAAVDTAKIILAQINPKMPRTHGDSLLHVSKITAAWECDEALSAAKIEPFTSVEELIAQSVASLIEDGSTIQTGIGSIPNAVLRALMNHKNLGVHTEMFSDGLLPLLQNGAVNNKMKKSHPISIHPINHVKIRYF